MAFGNPESFPAGGGKEKKENEKTSETKAEAVGKNQEQYRDPEDRISHTTTQLRDKLDPEAVKKLEAKKQHREQETHDDEDASSLDQAA